MVYAGAARWLKVVRSPRAKQLTKEWKARFHGTPQIVAILDRKLYKRDMAFVRAGQKLVMEAKRCPIKERFKEAKHACGFKGEGMYYFSNL